MRKLLVVLLALFLSLALAGCFFVPRPPNIF
jgi:hypothetical protein